MRLDKRFRTSSKNVSTRQSDHIELQLEGIDGRSFSVIRYESDRMTHIQTRVQVHATVDICPRCCPDPRKNYGFSRKFMVFRNFFAPNQTKNIFSNIQDTRLVLYFRI